MFTPKKGFRGTAGNLSLLRAAELIPVAKQIVSARQRAFELQLALGVGIEFLGPA
ncbi:hypothetical protein SAMN05444161_1387 [Rhizobiales bacterium GAS191]|nr:hypothetical protein SAMN05444161_1387 [Rhizobiales bacterium GAS191]